MVIFVGDELKGSWLREVVSNINEDLVYVNEAYHIDYQVNDILAVEHCSYIVYDVSQYIDEASVVADYIHRIENANNATPIILASGYLPTSNAVVDLIDQQLKYFIFASDAGAMKDEFLKCVNGFYEANGIDAVEEMKENIEAVKMVATNATLIGIGGIKTGIGTTTQCLQLVQYIQFCGYTAAYIELNNTGYVREVINTYEDVEVVDDTLGQIRYKNIDLFYKQDKISDVLQLGYNFYVYDYGIFNSPDFNKTSFLEKKLKIFVVGCKPNEMSYTANVLRSLFYQDVYYIFNFTPESDRQDLLENMEEKADKTFFADYTVDPFTYKNSDMYYKMLPLEIIKEDAPQKKGFSFFRKKK